MDIKYIQPFAHSSTPSIDSVIGIPVYSFFPGPACFIRSVSAFGSYNLVTLSKGSLRVDKSPLSPKES